MSKIAELQQLRAKKVNAQGGMIEAREAGETKEFSSEQETQFRALTTEIQSLDAKIETEQQIIDANKRQALLTGVPYAGKTMEEKEKGKIAKRFNMKRALSLQINKRSFDGVENEVNQIGIQELRSQGLDVIENGINIPSEMMFRADSHTVSQDGGDFGGALVENENGMVLPNFVDRLSIQNLGVHIKTGLRGNYPLYSGGEFEFQNVEETENLTTQKSGYKKRYLKPMRTGMKAAISYQLLAQSSLNVEQDVRGRISTALDKRLMLDLINGDGVAPNPLGLLNDPNIAFEYGGAEGVLTLKKILELEGEVDEENALGNGFKYLIHKKVAAFAKGETIDQGSGRFLMDMENKLYGTDTVRTTLLPILSGTSANYPLIYGDFSSVIAGFWGGMNIMVDPYSGSGSNELNLVINVHRDIQAATPKSFALNKKITLL